jgi:hypothetical protein
MDSDYDDRSDFVPEWYCKLCRGPFRGVKITGPRDWPPGYDDEDDTYWTEHMYMVVCDRGDASNGYAHKTLPL